MWNLQSLRKAQQIQSRLQKTLQLVPVPEAVKQPAVKGDVQIVIVSALLQVTTAKF